MEKEYQINFIIDLMELKQSSLKNQSLTIQREVMIQNYSYYAILDSLIALFCDKYKIKHNELKDAYYKRRFRNNN